MNEQTEVEKMLDGDVSPEVVDEFERVKRELIRQGRESLNQPVEDIPEVDYVKE